MKDNKQKEIVVILPRIRSVHNVGSVFRSSDVFGIKKIYITGYTATPKHPKIYKTALGAEKVIPWQYDKQAMRVIKDLKKQGYYILGLEKTKTSIDIRNSKPKFPLALIVGNEVTGIPAKYLKICDSVCHIEMNGVKESLNVSVAFGIAAFYLSHIF